MKLNKLDNFIIRLMTADRKSKNGLALPPKVIFYSLLTGFLFSILFGVTFYSILYNKAEKDLNEIVFKFIDENNTGQVDQINGRVKQLTKQRSLIGEEKYDALALANLIIRDSTDTYNIMNFGTLNNWLNSDSKIQEHLYTKKLNQIFKKQYGDRAEFEGDDAKSEGDDVSNKLSKLIIGEWRFWSHNLANLEDLDEDLKINFGITRPDFNNTGSIDDNAWKYYILVNSIFYFRDQLTTDYGKPLRLIIAFFGAIQWLTFMLFCWTMVMLLIRWKNVGVQKKVLDSDIWDVLKTNPTSQKPYFIEVNETYNYYFLGCQLIADCIEDNDGEDRSEHISDKVENMYSNVLSKDYLLIDFLVSSYPTLGFIGTIIGMVQAFVKAKLIVGGTNQLDKLTGFDEFLKAMAVAFDTSFVGLLSVLVASLFIAILRNREGRYFSKLESDALINKDLFLKN